MKREHFEEKAHDYFWKHKKEPKFESILGHFQEEKCKCPQMRKILPPWLLGNFMAPLVLANIDLLWLRSHYGGVT